MTMSIRPQDITGLILAGSSGDLGLHDSEVLPRVLQTLMRLSPQVGVLRIHAERNVARYAAMGVPVWTETADSGGQKAGSLSGKPGALNACRGILVGLSCCATPYLVAVSGDVPRFPLDIVLRLSNVLLNQRLDIVLAMSSMVDGSNRILPGCCLMRTSLRHSLQTHIQTNSGSFDDWLKQQRSGWLACTPEQMCEHSSVAGLSRQEPHVIA